MTDDTHPLLRREIVVFMAALPPGDPKPRFCAQIADGASFLPIIFRAHTKQGAVDAAETWRREEVQKEARKRENAERRVAEAKARRAA